MTAASIHWCEPPRLNPAPLAAQLLHQSDAYCDEHGITRARLGTLVMNDNKFLADVDKGKRGFTIRTFGKFQDFFAKERAEHAA